MRYPLKLPPALPGIYSISNRKTGQFYIGGTTDFRRRFGNWASFIDGGTSRVQIHMSRIFAGSDPADWDFVILIELPGASRLEVQLQEAKVIAHAARTRRQGMVNIDLPVLANGGRPYPTRGARGAPPKSTVLDGDGRSMAYAEVAIALGVGMKGLYSRLKQYRDRGINVLKLEDLKFLTDKYVSTKP